MSFHLGVGVGTVGGVVEAGTVAVFQKVIWVEVSKVRRDVVAVDVSTVVVVTVYCGCELRAVQECCAVLDVGEVEVGLLGRNFRDRV